MVKKELNLSALRTKAHTWEYFSLCVGAKAMAYSCQLGGEELVSFVFLKLLPEKDPFVESWLFELGFFGDGSQYWGA
jgi:hypothetical protein